MPDERFIDVLWDAQYAATYFNAPVKVIYQWAPISLTLNTYSHVLERMQEEFGYHMARLLAQPTRP